MRGSGPEIMKSNLVRTLMPITILSKILGISRCSCCVNADSTLYSSGSTLCIFMDIVQIIFYLACTFVVLQMPVFFYRYMNLFRYWVILIAMRFTEKWAIKLTNGIIAFDRKFYALPPTARVTIRTQRMWLWLVIYFAYFTYYTFMVIYMHVFIIQKFDLVYMIDNIFSVPRVTDFAVTATLCYYLGHIGQRFAALNTFWKRFVAVRLSRAYPGVWSADETAVLVECVRLLHADLSGLLRVFNRAYGPALAVFFSSVVFDMMFHWFITLFSEKLHLDTLPSVVLDSQNILFMVSVVGLTTWVSEQKKQIILFLRCSQISNLSKDIQIQIQFFMNQISTYETEETLACGMFDYKLQFLIPIIVLLVKIIATLLEMQDHPYLKQIINELIYNGPWNE